MSWFYLELCEADPDSDATWRDAWKFMYAGAPVEAGNAVLRGAALMYFTPSARALALTFGAQACAAPTPDGLHQVAGGQFAWKVHFPQSAEPAAQPAQPSAPARRPDQISAADWIHFQTTLPPTLLPH